MRLRICLPQHPAGRVNEDGKGRRTACCIVARARERLLGSVSTLSDVAARVSRREVTDLDEPRFRRPCAPVERECASREFRSYRGVFPAECNHLWIYARQLRPQLPEPAATQDQDGQVARDRVALEISASPSIALSKVGNQARKSRCVSRFAFHFYLSVVDVVSSNIAFHGVPPRHVI